MKKALSITVLLLSFQYCFAQSNSTLPIAVTIKVDSVYECTDCKENFEPVLKEKNNAIYTDSIPPKNCDVSVQIKEYCR
jgi:hypothetical protein